jgi:ubiquitin C-terminal hydrolase
MLNLTIARPPLSLCLHLRRLVVASRAQPTFVKLDTHIQFPIMLDLASYCGLGIDISSGLSTKPQAPINKLEYRLVAVIVHSGGAYGGHFTVYRRLDSSRWADISDDFHTFVDEQKVLESEAYMLYYERDREFDEEPIDNASLLSNINTQITSGLCFGLQHTLNGRQPTT